MGITNQDRQLVSLQIVNDFISRITGCNQDRVVGDIPDNVYYVGKLMSTEDEDNRFGSSRTFIDSIGLDFIINETEFKNAHIDVFPQGDLYYRAVPTLDEQRAYYVDEFKKINADLKVESFEKLIEIREREPERFNQVSAKLVPVYKKVSLNNNNFSIGLRLIDVLMEDGECGFVDETHCFNDSFREYIEKLEDTIREDKDWMSSVIREHTGYLDLLDLSSYEKFLRSSKSSRTKSQGQNWRLYFDINIAKRSGKYYISISLVNSSNVFATKSHRSQKNDKYSIETLFNSGFKVSLKDANYLPIKLDSFSDDYKYEKEQYALGNNCSVIYDRKDNSVRTEHIPSYQQYRLVTNANLAIKFVDLIDKPIETLEEIHRKMKNEAKAWTAIKDNKWENLTEVGREKILEEIQGFEDEISRFKFGIDVLKSHQIVRKSFMQMNEAFLKTSKKYDTWRLFQIVFIVSMIPDIVACDKHIMQDEEEREKTTLPYMSLLYFPTGGGKTEAFLGVLVFNLFFDRHRGKVAGVTSILRYPLRLLSVQQVQRLANVMAQAELIRRKDVTINDTFPFSLGYFVGDNNTPNSISDEQFSRYESMGKKQLDEHRVIDICPFCSQKTVHIRVDRELRRFIHYCDNPNCSSGGDLDLYIVDTEIYRYLPSAIISTVDKLAIMGCNANFRNILNGAHKMCPKHGFTSRTRCVEYGCDVEVQNFKDVEIYDPAPTLFIQDELHLIRESLGTYASHYESLLRYYIKNVSSSKRDIKVIGATATISSYREQVYHLYMREPIRFPCESIDIEKNFYSHIDKKDLQRFILGYAPFGKAVVNSMVFSIQYMREVINDYLRNPEQVLAIPNIGINTKEEAIELLKDYWIFLEYNNVKRDGNNVEGALETPVNVELERKGITPFISRKMTGDETFQDVREVLAQVENSENIFDDTNIIIATSMISHGVDADRFNNMFFYGIPGNMAEYIQAYSRTGRRYPSIVVDIIRPARETDMSFLRNFENMHKYKDLLVEAVPINRWATKAIRNTIPGIFTGLLLMKYDPELQYSIGTLFYMRNIKKAIESGDLEERRIINEMEMSYGCIDAIEIPQDLGNQYRDEIKSFISYTLREISDRAWENENIFEGFKLLGYRIMNSLRDTDDSLYIEME